MKTISCIFSNEDDLYDFANTAALVLYYECGKDCLGRLNDPTLIRVVTKGVGEIELHLSVQVDEIIPEADSYFLFSNVTSQPETDRMKRIFDLLPEEKLVSVALTRVNSEWQVDESFIIEYDTHPRCKNLYYLECEDTGWVMAICIEMHQRFGLPI